MTSADAKLALEARQPVLALLEPLHTDRVRASGAEACQTDTEHQWGGALHTRRSAVCTALRGIRGLQGQDGTPDLHRGLTCPLDRQQLHNEACARLRPWPHEAWLLVHHARLQTVTIIDRLLKSATMAASMRPFLRGQL